MHPRLVASLFWYWTPMFWSIDTCQNKVSADPYQVTISRAQLLGFFFIASQAHVRLTNWKQGRVVWKPVDANPGIYKLKYYFLLVNKSFSLLLFCVFEDLEVIQTQNRRPKNIYGKPHHKVQNWNQNSRLSWAKVVGLWTIRPWSSAFRLG